MPQKLWCSSISLSEALLELLTGQPGARWPAAMAATLLRPKKVHSLHHPLGYCVHWLAVLADQQEMTKQCLRRRDP